MKSSTRQQAIEQLFGKAHPDRRFQSRNVLQRLGQRFPDLMQEVADHAAGRIEESGDDIPRGRLMAIRIEAETLGLRQCLLDTVIQGGLVDETGRPHEAFPLVLRLTDQALRSLAALGLNPPKITENGGADVNPLDAWNRALATTGPSTTTAPSTDADSDTDADTDTDTDDNAEQAAVYEPTEETGE